MQNARLNKVNKLFPAGFLSVSTLLMHIIESEEKGTYCFLDFRDPETLFSSVFTLEWMNAP